MENIGDYVTGGIIGTGSFGEVYLAHDRVDPTTKLAIKKILKSKIIRYGMGDQVTKEIVVLKRLRHSNIVRIKEVLMSDECLFIVMEHVSGGELYGLIAKYGLLSEERCIKYTRQMCDALAFCHKSGICHRDIKPQNVLLDENDNVKIIDFGFASIMEVEENSNGRDRVRRKIDEFEHSMVKKSIHMKKLGTICGTEDYMAPEIMNSEMYNGDKVDIWSMGVMVYYLLMGSLPFRSSDKTRDVLSFGENIVLSNNAKNFIGCMLKSNPIDRLGAEELLKHPWIYNGENPIFVEEEEIINMDRSMTDDFDVDFTEDPVVIKLRSDFSIDIFVPAFKDIMASTNGSSWDLSMIGENIFKLSTTTMNGIHLLKVSILDNTILIENDDDDLLPLLIMEELSSNIRNILGYY